MQANLQGLQEGNAAQSNHSAAITATRPSWVQHTISASEQDARRQPWKKHFASNTVESRIDDSQDLVVVKKSVDDDPSCPFHIQGSSLAA